MSSTIFIVKYGQVMGLNSSLYKRFNAKGWTQWGLTRCFTQLVHGANYCTDLTTELFIMTVVYSADKMFHSGYLAYIHMNAVQ
jgi:hypothetical protein